MTLIALLSNLVIEENAAKISLLKVMGFTKREVDRMVLNIYTPFILLAIALSIPLAILLMKTIFYFIFGGYNVAFPIKMTVIQIVLSALTIFVGYLLSLRLNRKALNKIPLTIALKRE
jgi:putative ABC transport system permease protein